MSNPNNEFQVYVERETKLDRWVSYIEFQGERIWTSEVYNDEALAIAAGQEFLTFRMSKVYNPPTLQLPWVKSFETLNREEWDLVVGDWDQQQIVLSEIGTGVNGGRTFQSKGYTWVVWDELIAFDPDTLYEMKIRVRQNYDGNLPDNQIVLCGFECYGSDGVTRIDINGGQDYLDDHFFVSHPASTTIKAEDGWVEKAGYLQGVASTGQQGEYENITTPAKAHENVRYFRPVFAVNSDGATTKAINGSTGTVQVDSVSIVAIAVGAKLDGKQNASGFPVTLNATGGNYQVSLSYNSTTRKVTLTPSGSSFDIYVRGEKFTFTGTQVSIDHPATTGPHFYYHDGDGFVWTTTPWEFDDAPICFVYWSQTENDGVGYFELHTTSRDPAEHRRFHEVDGTQIGSGGSISGYVVDTDTDAAVTFSIEQTEVLDEDIQRINAALSDGGPYTVWWRTGAGGEWVWDTGLSLPFKYGTYPQYNEQTWGLTDILSGEYANYYLFAVPAIDTNQQYILIPGQDTYATEDEAKIESLADLSFGTLPFQEIAPLYQLTFYALATHGGTAKCKLVNVARLVGSKAIVTQTAVQNHNALSDIQGGVSGTYYHLTDIQHTDLTDSGDATIHYHSSDRNRDNHTGTQSVSTLSDYTLENLTDVTITTVGSNEIIQYTGAGWENRTFTEAGIIGSGTTAGGDLNGTYPNPSVDDGADSTAIHDNIAAEINAITEKGTPISGDWLLIEDSAAGNAKKKVQIGNLPSSGGATQLDDLTDVTITSLTTNEILQYTGSVWENRTFSEAGIITSGTTAGGDLNGTYPNPNVDDGADGSAIHDNIAGEINAITEKVSPVGTDLLIIEDSGATNAKKKIQISNLPAGATTLAGLTDVTITSVGNDEVLQFTGSVWENQTLAEAGIAATGHTHAHNDTTSIQGGTTDEYYHLTSAQHTDLTDSGDSTIHYHASDRNRSNHTGTQSVSTLSDYTLANLTDVTITSVGTDEILQWSGSAWINQTFAEADIATDTDLDAHTTATTSVHGIADTSALLTDITGEDLGDLNNVTITTVGNDEVLQFTGTVWENQTLSEAGIASSSDLSNHEADTTNIHGITDTSALLTDITNENLGDLSDVVITTVGDNDILAYDSGSGDWINQTAAEAGLSATGHTHAHNDTTSIQGGTAGQYYHLTSAQHTDLTDSGESTLHYHDSDRNRSNHTGTQSVSTLSDYTLANLTDVTITSVGNDEVLQYTGSGWENQTLSEAGISAVGHTHAHNDTTSIQGGTSGEYYHLTATQHTDLTDSGDSTLHYHSSDRNRANHTGTQSVSTLSDYTLANLTDVTITSVGNDEILQYTGSGWENQTLTEAGIGSQEDLDAKQDARGFPVTLDAAGGTYEVSLSYDSATRKVTLTPTGASFDIYVKGDKITTSGTHVSAAHPATTGGHFYFHNGSDWEWNTNPWNFDEAPVCYVYWSTTENDGVGYFELHTTSIDPAEHRRLHEVDGTQVVSGGEITGYTLDTDTDAGVTFGVNSTTILDEDIERPNPALADNGPYTVWYRTGAGGEWVWNTGNSLPFEYGTYPQWNNPSGPWTLVDLSNQYYCNYYLLVVPALATNQQYILVPGQAQYQLEDDAIQEDISTIAWGTLPFAEVAPLWKLTFQANASFGGTAKTKITNAQRLVGSKAIVNQVGVTNHNALGNIQGGVAGEYYHLSAAERTSALAAGTDVYTSDDTSGTNAAGTGNTGTSVTSVGYTAAKNNTGNNVVAIGKGAAEGNTYATAIAIGNNADPIAANNMTIGSSTEAINTWGPGHDPNSYLDWGTADTIKITLGSSEKLALSGSELTLTGVKIGGTITDPTADDEIGDRGYNDLRYLGINATADNSDLLDNQDGTYYLSRANHTGTQSVSTLSDYTLANLTDVTITSVGNDEVLQYTGSGWENQTLTEAGIAPASHSHVDGDLPSEIAYEDEANNFTADQTLSSGADLYLGTGSLIDFSNDAQDKVYWWGTTYGTGIETGTLTHWSATRHRWRIGGTSTTTGTERMALTDGELTLTGIKIGGSITDPTADDEVGDRGYNDTRYVNETDHTTAAHDALNIDADTVDSYEASQLLDRTNHTGTQSVSTLSNYTLANLTDVTIAGPASNDILQWSGTAWVDRSLSEAGISATGHTHAHNDTTSKQGGTTGQYYHLTSAQHTDLTDSGESTLHYHNSDRDRSNHSGTQLASTISNFDTQVRTNRLDQMAAPTATVSMNNQTLSSPLDPTAGTHVGDRDYNDGRYVNVTGDTMTGDLLINGGYAAGDVSLQTGAGEQAGGADAAHIAFAYQGTSSYRHNIRTRHHASQDEDNAIEWYLWDYGTDAVGTLGSYKAMELDLALGLTVTSHVSVGGTLSVTNDPAADDEVGDRGYNDGRYLQDITGENLQDLSNVTITSVTNDEVLAWSGSAWINQTASEAGLIYSGQTAGGDLGGTYPNPTVDDGADSTAIHDNLSGEINAITEKASPVSADLLIIEDSAATNAKKKAQIGNLPYASSSHTHDHTEITDFDAGVQTNRLDQMAAPTSALNINNQPIDTVNNIDFGSVVSDKLYFYSNTYGMGIESNTLTRWSANTHKWGVGGTGSASTTTKMTLTSSELTLTGVKIGGTITDPTADDEVGDRGYNDGRYLGISAKAADSEKLDNIDSTGFLRSNTSDDHTSGLITFQGGTDTALTDGSGHAQFGADGAVNIGIDGNEIQARNGAGAANTLYLNNHGGNVQIQNNLILNSDPSDDTHVGDRGYNDTRYIQESEVDADIKTLALPASTTISTFGASLIDDADAAAARTTLGVPASSHTHVHTDITDFDTGVRTNRLDQMASPQANVEFTSSADLLFTTGSGSEYADAYISANSSTYSLDIVGPDFGAAETTYDTVRTRYIAEYGATYASRLEHTAHATILGGVNPGGNFPIWSYPGCVVVDNAGTATSSTQKLVANTHDIETPFSWHSQWWDGTNQWCDIPSNTEYGLSGADWVCYIGGLVTMSDTSTARRFALAYRVNGGSWNYFHTTNVNATGGGAGIIRPNGHVITTLSAGDYVELGIFASSNTNFTDFYGWIYVLGINGAIITAANTDV